VYRVSIPFNKTKSINKVNAERINEIDKVSIPFNKTKSINQVHQPK